MSKISMPDFKKYIERMESVVNNIVDSNKRFTKKIIELEDRGWRDDVYKICRNQLFRLQEATNVFISRLEEIDSELIVLFGRIYDEYFKEDYTRIQLNMGRVEVLDDAVRKADGNFEMTLEAFEGYIESTSKYIKEIREELSTFDSCHRHFAEDFQTHKYEDLSDALKSPIAEMEQIMDDIEVLTAYVSEKRDILWVMR